MPAGHILKGVDNTLVHLPSIGIRAQKKKTFENVCLQLILLTARQDARKMPAIHTLDNPRHCILLRHRLLIEKFANCRPRRVPALHTLQRQRGALLVQLLPEVLV